MNLDNFLLHISLIDQVGPATINKILTIGQKLNLPDCYSLNKDDLVNFGFSDIIAHKIFEGLKDKSLLEKELSLIDKYKVKLVTIASQDYPELLKNIYLPPVVLYLSNQAVNFDKCISIVGARKADKYGALVIQRIVPELISYGYTIVSGGAFGIDTLAHKAALNAGGATISILGSGLLDAYPYKNKDLFSQITKSNNSSVISPFKLNAPPLSGNFPARNRIISGLSRLTIVVQAAESSGSLITAQCALDQGRDVGAVPGAIDNDLSVGCHKLIAQGASIITRAQDILELLNDNISLNIPKPGKESIKDAYQALSVNLSIEDKILELAKVSISEHDIIVHMNNPEINIPEILFNMQLEGLLEQDFIGHWKSSKSYK